MKAFTMKIGLRQGDGLSPLLFNVALNYIMKIWQKENPSKIKMGAKSPIRTNCLGFTDYLALSAMETEVLARFIASKKVALQVGLQVPLKKTVIML